MAYGRAVRIRSHRRGGTRRRRRRVPATWLFATLASVLVLTSIAFGYRLLLAQACSGEASAQVLAAPSTAPLIDQLANQWATTEPSTSDGRCARVLVESRDSAEVAADLAAGWDQGAGTPPDVWLPTTSAWVRTATAAGATGLPDSPPSVAFSPTVFAMPAPMAAQLGWPDPRLSGEDPLRWGSLLAAFSGDESGWAGYDQPGWGEFRLAMTDPARSTAGLLAAAAVADVDADGQTDHRERQRVFDLHELMDPALYQPSTEHLLDVVRKAGEEGGAEAVLRQVSAFPALEQEVLAYNRTEPPVPLSAIYPSDGTVGADYPYLTLAADWVSPAAREIAQKFLRYLREPSAQTVLREAGYRGPDRQPGPDIVPANGVVPDLPEPRAALSGEALTGVVDQWNALTRPTNMLLLFDVSGSMLASLPGSSEPRIEPARRAVSEVLRLFPDEASVGLWEFSTALDGDLDYRALVPMGPLRDQMEDGRLRREHTLAALETLVPRTDTGLYNTLAAAYDKVLTNYDSEATNLVVLITDGRNDTAGRPSLTLDELLTHLRAAPAEDQRVRVVTVAFSEQADVESLRRISEAAGGGGRVLYSEDGSDLVTLLRTAVFGGVP